MEFPIVRHFQTRNAVIAVNVVAALALIITVASAAVEINDIREVRNLDSALSGSAGGQTKEADFKVNEIVSAHLMGNPARVRATRVERVPTTKLNLALKGLLSSHDQEMARAIIAIGKKPDRLYAVGDKLEAGSATVMEIRDDLVLLDRNGKVESLPLPKKLMSANVSEDALYIPAEEQPAGSAVGEQVADPMAESQDVPTTTNIPPARRGPQLSNFSEETQQVLERMGARPAAALPITEPEE